MPQSRCMKIAYFLSILIAIGFVTTFTILTYFPRASNLVRSRMATVDVIVVGGGLAGISAAIEASRHGARVTIVEKERSLGGNSAKATSGINGAGSVPQADKEIYDSASLFSKDTLASGSGLSNAALVEILTSKSSEAIDFLMSFGLNLTDVVQLGGHSVARTHRIPPTPDGRPVPVGFTIISSLKKYLENELDGIVTVITDASFHSLIMDKNGNVVGIEYRGKDESVNKLNGNVILTSGGYANDHTSNSLLQKYVVKLSKLPTTNGPWATGDIIKLTAVNHLSLIHMDRVQTHPTGFIESTNPTHHTKFLAPESLRGCGAILLNSDGKRFVNELGRRDHVTDAIFSNCSHLNRDDTLPIVAVMIMNEEVIERFGRPAAGFYLKKGIIEDIGTIGELAERMRINVAVLKETFELYQKSVDEGEDEFGKVNFLVSFSPNDHFYVAFVTPTVHYCMGGLEINESTEVLQQENEDKKVVHGLYAAGEVTGGVHGMNRLGGNSLLECVVFGRIAGATAAHYKVLSS